MLDVITEEQLEPYLSGKIGKIPGCGIVKLDMHLRMKKNLTIIGGAATTGKTTSWLWILFTWAKLLPSHPKFLLFTNENDNVEIKISLIEWYAGVEVTEISCEHLREAMSWVDDHFQFLPINYTHTLVSLLQIAGVVHREMFDFDGFFIDPYNSLRFGSYHEHYANASWMRRFVDKYECKLMVSMHANSEAQRNRDKDGNIKCPHIANLEMGSMWYDRCDDAVIVHRQIQCPNNKYTTEVHVQKVKHKKSGGEPTDHDDPIKLVWNFKFNGYEWPGGNVVVPDSTKPQCAPRFDASGIF